MVREIIFNDEFVKIYSRKIMGFAYVKTGNTQLAEDLSQDVLLALANSLKKNKDIADMDGFVYTICCYTWSKFLRQNKKHWNNIDIEAVYDLSDDSDLEEQVNKKILIDKMKTEIAYLTKLHRQIIIMFYYENKPGDEISQILNIPHSTVRWHLGEIRKKIKEGIEMTDNYLNCIPKRIMAGHDGYTLPEYGQCGLGQDRIVDNICLACYGKALSIEEIARTLSVACAYLENHIEKLVYMDYLKNVGKNKYQTNFFISTIRHGILEGKYHYENIAPNAIKIYNAFNSRYDRIKGIGFIGNDLDKDFVLWAIITLVTNDLYYNSLHTVLKKNNINIDTPKRKDGSQHWVCATLTDDDYFKKQTEFSDIIIDFYKKSRGNGIKTRSVDNTGLSSLQLDSKATIDIGKHWRIFDDPELNEMARLAEIIINKETPNEMDKLIIAKTVENGYVKVENDHPKILIPYFTKVEFDKLTTIIDEIKTEVGLDVFESYIENFVKQHVKEIPDFVPEADRIHFSYNIYPQYAVLYYLSDNGYLRYPDNEEAKRLCTVVWNAK